MQLSAERLSGLPASPTFRSTCTTAGSAGRVCISNTMRKAGNARSLSSAMPSGKIPTFSPCYSSLVQMNNIEHFVHPGIFRDLGKAKATLELAKRAVQLDPVDSRAHLCCGWSYRGASGGRGGAAYGTRRRVNDNDPWTLLSSCGLLRFLRIDR